MSIRVVNGFYQIWTCILLDMDMFLEPEADIVPRSQHPVSRGAYWPSVYFTLSALYATNASK